MGRGISWDAAEREVAAKAWISATANNVSGADQKESQFASAIHRYVIQFAPANADPRKYGGRKATSIFKFLKTDVMKDVNLFSISLNKVYASKPTGHPSETDIHCMAIALHTGMTYTVNSKYMTTGELAFNPRLEWNNYLAFLVLKNHPKFFTCPNAAVNMKQAAVRPYTTTADIASSCSTKATIPSSSSAVPANKKDNTNSDISVSDESEIETTPLKKHNNSENGTSRSKRRVEISTSVEKQLSSSEILGTTLEVSSKRSKVGQKKAKSQLKDRTDQKERDENFKVVSKSMASLAETHEGLLSVLKANESHRKLKLLKFKYRLYKQENNNIKANEVYEQIKALTDKLLGDEDDDTENVDPNKMLSGKSKEMETMTVQEVSEVSEDVIPRTANAEVIPVTANAFPPPQAPASMFMPIGWHTMGNHNLVGAPTGFNQNHTLNHFDFGTNVHNQEPKQLLSFQQQYKL
jgi:hypothetical protein